VNLKVEGVEVGTIVIMTIAYPPESKEPGSEGAPPTGVLTTYRPPDGGQPTPRKYAQTAQNDLPDWYVLDGATIAGNIVTYTIQDGGYGDNDLTANGVIINLAGPAVSNFVLTGALPATGQVGVAYEGVLTAGNGVGPYTWGMATGSLPPGLELLAARPDQPTATLSGTPTQAGTYTFTLQVVDQGLENILTEQAFTVQMGVSDRIYTVTPTVGMGGGIDPATPQTVADGAMAIFMVTADTGYTLAAVSGCGGTLSGTTYTTAVITADCEVQATFQATSVYSLTVVVTGAGTVTSAPAGIQCRADCTESYPQDTRVTLTATPAARATFLGWTGACTGTVLTCPVTLTAARTVTGVAV